MQVRTSEPRTLDEAVQFAVDKCGEYGEGHRVTDWRVAKRRYREGRELAEDDAAATKHKKVKTEPDQIDWKKLGLGFGVGLDTPPNYDTAGRAVSGLAKASVKDPLSLVALQALVMASGVQDPKPAACKPKAAKTLEIKTEEDVHAPATGAQDNQQTHNRYGGGGGYRGPGGSGGRQGSGGGRGAGRGGGRSAYGPPGGYKSIAQRKAETSCGHCGEAGHWWRECRIRLAEETKMEQENAASSNQAAGTTAAPTAASASGNAPRQ
uniref:CCHC-type domain-containing protein n=1 Tax=Phytophthora fragariae TaxID=53985 RepID=A0A6A3E2V2_9STRA|nr:hypothetical protein PF009_g25637 [Phytophthora fragariae]